MLVYVVCRGYAFQGLHEPEAVFSTREKAEKYVASVKEQNPAMNFFIDFFELVVN